MPLLVRRPTGGGAILHAGGICFSYVAHRQGGSQERHTGPRWLKTKILKGLSALGLTNAYNTFTPLPRVVTGFTHPTRPNMHKTPRVLETWCGFEEADSDIIVRGKKMGGIAQRILKRAILLEGYLMLRRRECVWMDRMRSQNISFMDPVQPISLEEILRKPLSVRYVFAALRA